MSKSTRRVKTVLFWLMWILTVIYWLSPIDLFPGPIDDLMITFISLGITLLGKRLQ